VHGRELRAVRNVAVASGAQIADVVEQRDDDAEHRALGTELLRIGNGEVVPRDQARRGERDVERVLLVVVDGIDAEVAGHAAREHALEIAEDLRESRKFVARPDAREQLLDRGANIGGRAHEYRVGDVVIAAAGFSLHAGPEGGELTRWASLGTGCPKEKRTDCGTEAAVRCVTNGDYRMRAT
jgi:hypothetical protein